MAGKTEAQHVLVFFSVEEFGRNSLEVHGPKYSMQPLSSPTPFARRPRWSPTRGSLSSTFVAFQCFRLPGPGRLGRLPEGLDRVDAGTSPAREVGKQRGTPIRKQAGRHTAGGPGPRPGPRAGPPHDATNKGAYWRPPRGPWQLSRSDAVATEPCRAPARQSSVQLILMRVVPHARVRIILLVNKRTFRSIIFPFQARFKYLYSTQITGTVATNIVNFGPFHA